MEMSKLESRLTSLFAKKLQTDDVGRVSDIVAELLNKMGHPSSSSSKAADSRQIIAQNRDSGSAAPSASDAFRNVQSMALSLDHSLRESGEEEQAFRSRLDQLAGSVKRLEGSGNLLPVDQAHISHYVAKIAEILEPFTQGNFPAISPEGKERVRNEIDNILNYLEEYVDSKSENLEASGVKAKSGMDGEFEKFIGSGDATRTDMPQGKSASGTKAVTNPIAQNLTNGPANQAMLDLGVTYRDLPTDVSSAYADSAAYFRQLLKAGPRIVGAAERSDELSAADSTRVQDIAKAISEVLTGPVPNPTEFAQLLESFEDLLKEISGTEYIFL